MDFALPDLDTRTLSEKGVEFTLRKLDGETPIENAKKKPVTLKVLGSDSATWRRVNRAYNRLRLEVMQQAGGKVLNDEQLDKIDAAEIKMYAQMTVGWSGLLDSKKQEIPFSLENCIDLYTKMPPAKEQAERAIGDRNRFIQPS